VYRASFPGGFSWVIKLPRTGTSLQAFRKEVELLNLLASGPIPVPLVELDHDDLVVMQDIPGLTLEDYARESGPASESAWRSTGRLTAHFREILLDQDAQWLNPR
jgi:predicted Ser/Thr protein kinase